MLGARIVRVRNGSADRTARQPGRCAIYTEHPHYLLGENQGCLLDIPRATANDLLEGKIRSLTNITILDTAKDMWRRGLVDEATFIVSMSCLRKKEICEDLRGQELVMYATDDAEFELMKIICKTALLLTASGVHDESEYCELSLHAYAWALSGKFRIHAFTSSRTHGTHNFVNTFIAEDFHPTLTLTPLGIIPNAMIWCYIASTLTIVLSIDSVSRAIMNMYKNGQDLDESTVSFLETLLLFYTHLRTDCLDDATLIAAMQKLFARKAFAEFNVDASNDSYYFLEILAAELKDIGIDVLSEKRIELDSLTYVDTQLCEKRKPKQLEMPCRVTEWIENDNRGGSEWRANIEDIPLRETSRSPDCIYGALVYKSRKTGKRYTFDQYVTDELEGHTPAILFIKHQIGNKESPGKFIVPCVIYVGETLYSLHGASMHDAVHTDGHYTALIASNTTMFYYDSQHGDHDDDMRAYRIRYLCYLRRN